MKRFWKKQLPAFLLVLIMVVSLVPAAMAEGETGRTGEEEVEPIDPPAPEPEHKAVSGWSSDGSKHWHDCSVSGCNVHRYDEEPHESSAWINKGESGHEKKCTVCQAVIATGTHDVSPTITGTEPATCYRDGKNLYACKDGCGYNREEVIKATGDHKAAADADWSSDTTYHWHACATPGCTYSQIDRAAHSYTAGEYATNDKQHWQICTVCKGTSGKTAHTPDSTGKCTVCKQQVANAICTVTFMNGSSRYVADQTVTKGGRVYSPGTPTYPYSGNYKFVGWTAYYPGSNAAYNNQSDLWASSYTVTSNVTFYAVYDVGSGSTITYTVDAGEEEDFNPKDFKKIHDAACSDTFEYVTFSVSSSTYNKFTGSVYSGKTELSASDLKSDFYYDEDDVGKDDYALDDLSLVAPKGAKDSSITISFTTYGSKNKSTTGTLKLEVGGSGDGTITYKVAPGGTVEFNASDFNSAYKEMSGSSSAIRWVAFSATSAYTSFDGTLYCGSTAFSKSDLSYTKTTFYYSSKSYGDYDLNSVSFTADKDADDGDSLSLTFRAYRSESDYETGTVKIVIDGDAVSGDITYEVAPGGKVDFDRAAFNKFFQKEYKNYTVSYVEFDKPSAAAFTDGTLYHDYGGSSQTSFTRTSLSGTKFYYSPGSKDYDLDELTFKADSDFEDDVTLTFTAYGSGSRYVEGSVVIRSNKKASDSGDITLTVTPGKSVDLDKTKFQSFLRSESGDKKATVDYVTFDRPASSVFSDGTLYSSYGKSSQVKFTYSNLGGYTFYYDSKDATGSKEYGLDTLTFVADSTFKDSIKLTFTVYGDDDEEEEGTLVIKSDGTAAATSNYVGSIRYATTTGTKVQINANDIARFFSKNAYGGTMQYVTITGVPTSGSLYYNYYNTSKYGTTTRAQLTAANCSGQAFYASPTATNQFALTELTYVPSSTNYCASIPFTAYGGSRSVSGAILISVSGSTVAEVYGVTPKNTAVTFPASNISKAVAAATGTTPASIQLLSLPAYTAGAVYVGTGTTTPANTTSAYSIFSSGGQSLRFVPATGYTGSVEIPYVALNSYGSAIASGCFSLGVVSTKKSFTDVSESTWCYKYVAELSSASVIDGYSNGSFKPNNTVTYGAALKLIMLAAGYSEQAPTGKNVFSGYLDKARADGIVTRSNIDLTKPITRLQVAQLAAGAMKLNTSNLSTVQPFTDTTDTSVRALNAAGIVEGYFSNGTSTFKPNNTLTRGQVAAIVWRMRNYNK